LDFFRYERKKNIALAISALQHFKTLQRKPAGDVKERKVLLVVAGGYDVRVTENVEYLKVASICARLWAVSAFNAPFSLLSGTDGAQ
jgi:alpha-1,3/alpha-1,6-mannosyltransferase